MRRAGRFQNRGRWSRRATSGQGARQSGRRCENVRNQDAIPVSAAGRCRPTAAGVTPGAPVNRADYAAAASSITAPRIATSRTSSSTASSSPTTRCSRLPSLRIDTSLRSTLPLAEGEDDRRLRVRVLAHLVRDLLVAGIDFRVQASRTQRLGDLARVGVGVRRNRAYRGVLRREPQGQMPCVMFDKYSRESFDGAKHRAVEHHRHVALAVLADVGGPEPARQVEVDLHRAALPVAANRVA